MLKKKSLISSCLWCGQTGVLLPRIITDFSRATSQSISLPPRGVELTSFREDKSSCFDALDVSGNVPARQKVATGQDVQACPKCIPSVQKPLLKPCKTKDSSSASFASSVEFSLIPKYFQMIQ